MLHARYLEMVTPAVAAAVGCGLASLISAAFETGRRARVAVAMLAAALGCVCLFTLSLPAASFARTAAFGAGALVAVTVAAHVQRAARQVMGLAGGLALACCLSFPIRASEAIVRSQRSDSPPPYNACAAGLRAGGGCGSTRLWDLGGSLRGVRAVLGGARRR